MRLVKQTIANSRYKWIAALIIVIIYLFTALSLPIQQIELEPLEQHSFIVNDEMELSDMVHIRLHTPSGMKLYLKLFMFVIVYLLLQSTLWMIPYRYICTSITSSMKRLLLMPIKRTTSTYSLIR